MSNNEIICTFLNYKEKLTQCYHLLYTIKYLVAPVLYNTKPGATISFKKGKKDLYDGWENYKDEVCKQLNISYKEVSRSNDSVCIFIYKKKALDQFLSKRENAHFLEKYGYFKTMDLDEKIRHLMSRYHSGCPDEIGVFLGFPIDDVKSYIEHDGEHYKQCRYWKVYHNEDKANYTFKAYDCAKIAVAKEALNTLNIY